MVWDGWLGTLPPLIEAGATIPAVYGEYSGVRVASLADYITETSKKYVKYVDLQLDYFHLTFYNNFERLLLFFSKASQFDDISAYRMTSLLFCNNGNKIP